ncbi:unnamed protein product, partial [Discosporangium mesarthrocarpum]
GGSGRFWLTRVLFLRGLGFIYLVAFLVALNDNAALLGEDGLLPANRYLSRVGHHLGDISLSQKFYKVPTVFWFVPATARNLDLVAGAGVALSAIVFILGAGNLPLMAALWVLYHSIVNVGQAWYSFGHTPTASASA